MKSTGSRRHERLKDLILEEVSRVLLLEVKDPRIGRVTVTGAELSQDIRIARLFYCVGKDVDDSSVAETQKGLESASGFIRSALAANLDLKRTPEIVFVYDKTLDYGEKIDKILEDLKREA